MIAFERTNAREDLMSHEPDHGEALQWGEEEEAFWRDGDDDVDPELLSLADAPARDSVLRPILLITVLIMGAMIISDWREELAYFASDPTPIQVGAVDEFPMRAAQEKGWTPNIPHNRYVEISGIPTKRAISEKYRYHKLVGGEVYIEALREDFYDDALTKEARGKPKAEADRAMFVGRGRAVSFAAIPGRYAGIKMYYERHYNTKFCIDITQAQKDQLERERRDAVRATWRKQYAEASQADRDAGKVTPEPTKAEIDLLLGNDPVCVDAWLIQIDRDPSSHWWYVALTALFGIFMLVDFVILINWIRRFLAPADDL